MSLDDLIKERKELSECWDKAKYAKPDEKRRTLCDFSHFCPYKYTEDGKKYCLKWVY